MKSIFASLLLVMVLVAGPSCKKDKDSDFQSYLRFNLDGEPINCTSRIYASYFPVNLPGRIRFGGGWDGGDINLSVEDEPYTITPKAYPFEIGRTREAELYLRIGLSTVRFAAGTAYGYPGIDGNGQITITALTADYVKGTFSFTTPSDTNPAKTVTGGSYQIRF